MTKLNRMEERLAIKARLDDVETRRRNVNNEPAVIEARARCSAARAAAAEASNEFDRVWRAHYPDDPTEAIAADYPDVMRLGEHDYARVSRCAATGLPIFAGDEVIVVDAGDTCWSTMTLAAAVSIDPALGVSPEVTRACMTGSGDDDELDDDDDSVDLADELLAASTARGQR